MNPYAQTLAGKVAFVTGVGSGIGRATALLLAQAGARIGALTPQQKEADATCRAIREQGGEALPLVGNVASSPDLEAAVDKLQRAWGRIDIVVANAGINGLWAPLDQIGEEQWQQTLEVNLKGTFLTVKHALPFLKRTGGSIVIVASVNGTRIFSNSGATAYSSSKAAQVAFGRMTALEFAKHRIRVNTVCPGAIDTQIGDNTTHQNLAEIREPVVFPHGEIPLTGGQSGSSEQVARLIWFLSSDLADHITGTEVYIDGGQSLLQG